MHTKLKKYFKSIYTISETNFPFYLLNSCFQTKLTFNNLEEL